MISKETEVAGLEHEIKGTKQIIEHGKEVTKLVSNSLFRKVILEEFCTKQCARYVQESGDPLLDANQRADALAMAQSAGHLRRWLDLAIRMGDASDGRLSELEQELDYMRSQPEDE